MSSGAAGRQWSAPAPALLASAALAPMALHPRHRAPPPAPPRPCAAWFFLDNSRYQGAMAVAKDAAAFARAIAAAGYATDPNYATSLINLINQYGLTKFDLTYA